jgi:hypothetical protein
VTRSGATEGIAELFASSADAAVLRVLRDCGKALVKAEILDELATAGVPRPAADDAWGRVQKHLRLDKRVIAERDRQTLRYRWNPTPPPIPSPADALRLLVEGRLTRGEREALADTVRAALEASRPTPARPSRPTKAQVTAPAAPAPLPAPTAETVSLNRLRQVEMDAARALAELAIEVEEHAAKGASAKAIIHRVRARMKRLRLEPIEQAGTEVAFNRARHQPLRAGIPDGATVLVVRPGYVWRAPGEDLAIERPLVQD